MKIKRCENCKSVFTNRWQLKYCSNLCQFEAQYKKYIKEWKLGKKDGNIGVHTRNLSGHLKKYLRDTYGDQCSICGWNKEHPTSKKVPLEIDHIDGNAENNSENNLRLLCPNCHALKPNFKNFNKGNGRQWRSKKYVKN